jgi:hypothetical protein
MEIYLNSSEIPCGETRSLKADSRSSFFHAPNQQAKRRGEDKKKVSQVGV